MAVLGNVSIRTATTADVPVLDAHPQIDNLRSCDHAAADAAEYISVLVATIEETIVAHVNIRWTGFRLEPFTTDYPNTAIMYGLGIWPDTNRNLGIGSLLVENVEQRAQQQNMCRVGLGFYVENTEVRRFYERHGYRSASSEAVIDYYDPDHRLVIMVKEL